MYICLRESATEAHYADSSNGNLMGKIGLTRSVATRFKRMKEDVIECTQIGHMSSSREDDFPGYDACNQR